MSPSFRSTCPRLLASLVCLQAIAIGCAEPTTGHVSGKVSVDGQPATGSIAFFPLDGRGVTAGAEIVEGRYDAEVPLGDVRVEIRVPKIVGHKKLYDTADSPEKAVMEELLPARYNDQSELHMEVKPGSNEKDYALTTQQSAD